MKRILYILLFIPLLLQAQIGQLPARSTMRVYYHLEDVNDASGNSQTLTNNNSVPFNAGKFNLGADFGSSGTDKSLTRVFNPMSALTYADATYSMWVKFNNSASSNPTAGILQVATRTTSGAGAARTVLGYNITGGNIVFTATTLLTTTNITITHSEPANTTIWYNCVLIKSGTTTLTLYVNGVQVATGTGSGSDNVNVPLTYCLAIGNRQVTPVLQAWATIDEVIIEERIWTASEIRKYYSQGRGFLAPQ